MVGSREERGGYEPERRMMGHETRWSSRRLLARGMREVSKDQVWSRQERGERPEAGLKGGAVDERRAKVWGMEESRVYS